MFGPKKATAPKTEKPPQGDPKKPAPATTSRLGSALSSFRSSVTTRAAAKARSQAITRKPDSEPGEGTPDTPGKVETGSASGQYDPFSDLFGAGAEKYKAKSPSKSSGTDSEPGATPPADTSPFKSLESTQLRSRQPRLSGSAPSLTEEPGSVPSGFRNRWDARLEKYPLLGKLEQLTGIRKVYMALAFLLLCCAVVFRGLGMTLACALAGFVYPVYMSFKTIEQPSLPFLRQWLMYFIVHGLFTTIESFSDTALSWLPMYYPSKLAFLLWCFLPRFNGATVVFNTFVKPVLVANQQHIDSSLLHAHKVVKLTAAHVREEVGQRGQTIGRAIRIKSQDISNTLLRKTLNANADGSGSDGRAAGSGSDSLRQRTNPAQAPAQS